MPVIFAAASLLAAASKTTKSPSAWDEPGTLGFLVVFGLAVIMYFVFRSMSKHLRKVREAAQLEADQQAAAEGAQSGSQLPGSQLAGTQLPSSQRPGSQRPGTVGPI
jgi:hypothetical protein